jgi:hypothetical protein
MLLLLAAEVLADLGRLYGMSTIGTDIDNKLIFQQIDCDSSHKCLQSEACRLLYYKDTKLRRRII